MGIEGLDEWRAVEGSGGLWRGVDGCGRVWTGVDGCGRVCGGVWGWMGVNGCRGVWVCVWRVVDGFSVHLPTYLYHPPAQTCGDYARTLSLAVNKNPKQSASKT